MDDTNKLNLKYLFEKKARLDAELQQTNDLITQYGRKYWCELGYTVMPRIEKLRVAILGESK